MKIYSNTAVSSDDLQAMHASLDGAVSAAVAKIEENHEEHLAELDSLKKAVKLMGAALVVVTIGLVSALGYVYTLIPH